jgi:lipase maturation factor 1
MNEPAPKPRGGPLARAAFATWNNFREYWGYGVGTCLWPRWIVLRAIGLLYLIIFGGIIHDGSALIGPKGITPLAGFFDALSKGPYGPIETFLRAPSLLWLGNGSVAIGILAWAGFLSGVALALNIWPRAALISCWTIFLSFVSAWHWWSSSMVDQVMLETTFVCIPFAPGGILPGLGRNSPPRRIFVFMIRWLLFRIMFECGIFKLATGDPYWRQFNVMKVLYETAPFPTVIGYLDHQLPYAYHFLEVGLTFAAELLGPFTMIFCGRWGRWVAFGFWVWFQAGIQMTMNFGWLNTAAIGLGILLLDDAMLAGAARKLRLPSLARRFAEAGAEGPKPRPFSWRTWTGIGALGLHFAFSVYFFFVGWADAVDGVPYAITRKVDLAWFFQTANVYYPFARMTPMRFEVEFEGSNDGGATWRTYEYKYSPQDPTKISGFIAPRYIRFEATLQIAVFTVPKSPLFASVAAELLTRNPDVIALFAKDPFPPGTKPPTVIRMPVYRISFTDLATRRKTGRYWNKEYEGDFVPPVYLDEQGRIAGGN